MGVNNNGERSTTAFKLSDGMAIREVRLALPDFYDVAVGIANVAARLSILLLWRCDEAGSSISP